MALSLDSTSQSDRRSSTSSDANAFPKPVGATLVVPDPYIGQPSPQRSIFSFEDHSPRSTPSSQPGELETTGDRKNIFRAMDYGAPGEKPNTEGYKSKRRTRYYEDQFQYKNPDSSARERVQNDSPVIAELKTNVIIKDEYTLITDLSYHLSTRYHRPESSIMISITHSACLLLGGTFDPAYILDVTALPNQIQPATNKRNAALIQQFMSDILSVPADRGIIRFQSIPEQSLAINGRTILGEIERLERQRAEESATLKRTATEGHRKSLSTFKRKSVSSISQTQRAVITPPIPSPPIPSPGLIDSAYESGETPEPKSRGLPANRRDKPFDESSADMNGDQPSSVQQLRSKRSSPLLTTALPQPPPVPADTLTPKPSKRKSLMSMFRR